MRAIVYTQRGGPDVLKLVHRPVPRVGPGEVRVRIAVSGVNPTDWKARLNMAPTELPYEQVPNQDGAGTVDAVGEGVNQFAIGERVWVWDAAWQRPGGTAQEFVVLPVRQVVALPDSASFDVGASLGIPALTAHHALTSHAHAPRSLRAGSLAGMTVLVTGGAGAVGHAAIQLARWAGAEVAATVSSFTKGGLARTAGASEIINYQRQDAANAYRSKHPRGADIVVDVDAGQNMAASMDAVANGGTIAVYATAAQTGVLVAAELAMQRNVRLQFILTYTVSEDAKQAAVAAVSSAVAAGAMGVGVSNGLPLHRFTLEDTAAAHTAVENCAVGKVLIDVSAVGERADT